MSAPRSRSGLDRRLPASTSAGPRMSAEERREHVLQAATRAFARGGYAGTSTDAVAREAGVSQPYVVRIFGSKQELFLQVFDRAGRRVDEAFTAVLAEPGFDASREEDLARLGEAYTDLLEDRDLMLCLMHGFTAGDQEDIGAVGRTWMSRIFAMLIGHGMSEDAARDFIAYGMLLNVLMGIRVPEHAADEPSLGALATCVFGSHLEQARGR
jgi:AcrR family transcriptional regulator